MYPTLVFVSDGAWKYLDRCHCNTTFVAVATSTGAEECRHRWTAVIAYGDMSSSVCFPFQRRTWLRKKAFRCKKSPYIFKSFALWRIDHCYESSL